MLKILLKHYDYKVDYDYFSDEELKNITKDSNWNYNKICNLID